MDLLAEDRQILPDLLAREIELLYLLEAHGDQRILWPSREPIKRAAVHQRGEFQAAKTKGVPDWRHAEDDVEVVSHSVDKDLKELLWCSLDLFPVLVFEVLEEFGLLVAVEEVWNFAGIKKVVDVLKKGLLDDLRIGEDEGQRLVLDPRLLLEILDLLPEGLDQLVLDLLRRLLLPTLGLPLRDSDIKDVVLQDVGAELRQRLLPGAADTDEHRVPAGLPEDTEDSQEVVDAIVKEDEVHSALELVIVVILLILQELNQLLLIEDLLILGVIILDA